MRDGWRVLKLGDFCEIQQGQNLAISQLTTGRYPVYGANGVVGRFDEHNFSHKVVALGCRGSCGTIHVVQETAWLANNVMAVWPMEESETLCDFIALLLETADLKSSGVISGQVQPQITRTSLRPLECLVPTLSDQRRIVDLIASVDAYIESLQQKVDAARTARNSVLHDLLSAGGDDWTETTLGTVARCAGGTAFPHKFQGGEVGIPFYKVSDMNSPGNGKYLTVAQNSVSHDIAKQIGARVWPKGTVVFAKVGAALLTEKRRVLVIDSIFDNNVMGLVSGPSILSEFLFLFMETIRLGDYVQPGAVPSVNNRIVGDIQIDLPTLRDQERIVELVSSMDEAISASESARSSAMELRSGLLADLLSGEHEIPDSYDRFLGAA